MRTMMDLSDYEHVERIRKREEAVVQDRDTAEALKPYYRLFCKRPCFVDYLPTFNRENVKLVDTNDWEYKVLPKMVSLQMARNMKLI